MGTSSHHSNWQNFSMRLDPVDAKRVQDSISNLNCSECNLCLSGSTLIHHDLNSIDRNSTHVYPNLTLLSHSLTLTDKNLTLDNHSLTFL